ncbi:MAG: A/G-specific adenine glycosylase, partial [Rhodobacteraceae bacterium]|nr:A/G-specific adenine glycosylase [Paracoccaceae bacterium]
RHVFTHFQLRLRVEAARVAADFAPPHGAFVPRAEALDASPTAMRKALLLGLALLGG